LSGKKKSRERGTCRRADSLPHSFSAAESALAEAGEDENDSGKKMLLQQLFVRKNART
jgi:hypothetical protein